MGGNYCNSCRHRKTRYKVTTGELKTLMKIEHCMICGVRVRWGSRGSGKACIDHCHKSSDVRGVLCNSCNLIEGHIRDWDHLDAIQLRLKEYILKGKFFQ